MVKKLLALFLVVLMSIESFGAVVGDNDGSAFITKAEFDSLKNDFQSQIDQYNTSIDAKIDGAIASYLNGISVSKTSENAFALGGGDYVLIIDSDKINDLSWGYADIDFKLTHASQPFSDRTDALDKAGFQEYLKFERSNSDYSYEFFNLNSDKNFDCWLGRCKVSLTASASFMTSEHLNGYSAKLQSVLMRWHGTASGSAPTLKREHQRSSVTAYYSDRLADQGFWQHYGTRENGMDQNIGLYTIRKLGTVDCSIDVVEKDKIKWIFDSGFGGNTLWTIPFNTLEGKEQACAGVCTNYADATVAHPVSYTDPSQCSDLSISYWASGFGNRNTTDGLWETSSISWTTQGAFNKDTSAVTALPWYEFQFLNTNKKSNTIKNSNITTALLDDFGGFNFTGMLDQGFPIGLMPYDSTVEFELDTTSLEDNSVIAFSSKPFSSGATSKVFLEDTSDDNTIDLFIDSINVGKSLGTLSPGKHKIKLEINGSTSKVPLFWKMAWPKGKTKSPRKYIIIPSMYTLTDNT